MKRNAAAHSRKNGLRKPFFRIGVGGMRGCAEMENGGMQKAALDFVGAVKASAEYQEYEMQLAKIKNQPELYEKVNEFRQKNFIIQNTENSEDILDRMEELEREYEEVREVPLVDDFLEAETSFCRMMQEINMFITKELDFQ